jgi:hypothetical protein
LAGGAHDTTLDAQVHCTDDSRGNWIACQQTVKSVYGGEKMWRRKITYR